MNSKYLAATSLVALAAGGWFGYQQFFAGPDATSPAVVQCTAAQGSVTHPRNELALQGDPWSGYQSMRDANYKKALAADGYKFSYDTETDQSKRACNMASGSIDFMVTTAGQVVKHKTQGKIVGMIDESAGADALVLNTTFYPYLQSKDQIPQLVLQFKKRDPKLLQRLADEGAAYAKALKDAPKGDPKAPPPPPFRETTDKPTLVYSGDSPSEELMNELASISEELKLTDFHLVAVDQSSTALTMLQKNPADLAIIWEPDTSAAKTAGYVVAMSSKDVPRRILDVIVASDRIVRDNPDAVQAVVTEFYKARKWNASHPDKYLDIIAKDSDPNLKPDEAQSVLDGIHLFDAAESDQWLNVRAYPLDQVPISESLRAITRIEALISDPSLKVSDQMWDGRFVAQAAKDLR